MAAKLAGLKTLFFKATLVGRGNGDGILPYYLITKARPVLPENDQIKIW
jgi:hypothetical protein